MFSPASLKYWSPFIGVPAQSNMLSCPHAKRFCANVFIKTLLPTNLNVFFLSYRNNHDDAKKGPENVKKQNGVEEADAWKENSKNGANRGGASPSPANRGGAAATNAGPLPLDAEGLPPLRFANLLLF